MKEKKLTAILSEEEKQEYEAKALELKEKYKCANVYTYIGIHPTTLERIVSYIQEPNYMTKLALMDKAGQVGINMAGEELRMICQLKDESHPLTYGDTFESEPYKLGVVQLCITTITMIADAYKKK
jgi:hypothetical protein